MFYVVNIRVLGLINNKPRNLKLPDVWEKIDCDSNKNLPIQRKFKRPSPLSHLVYSRPYSLALT